MPYEDEDTLQGCEMEAHREQACAEAGQEEWDWRYADVFGTCGYPLFTTGSLQYHGLWSKPTLLSSWACTHLFGCTSD